MEILLLIVEIHWAGRGLLGMPPVLDHETGREVLGRMEAHAKPCLAITWGTSVCTHGDEKQRGSFGRGRKTASCNGVVRHRKKEKVLFLVSSSRWTRTTVTRQLQKSSALCAQDHAGFSLSYSLVSLLGTDSAVIAGTIISQ